MSIFEIFKTCSKCPTKWNTRADFLSDSSIELNGYQADPANLAFGLFLFTHKASGCLTTMAVFAYQFYDLYSGPHYPEVKALSPECPRYCLNEKNLERCDVLCECAFVREVIQIIQTPRGHDGMR